MPGQQFPDIRGTRGIPSIELYRRLAGATTPTDPGGRGGTAPLPPGSPGGAQSPMNLPPNPWDVAGPARRVGSTPPLSPPLLQSLQPPQAPQMPPQDPFAGPPNLPPPAEIQQPMPMPPPAMPDFGQNASAPPDLDLQRFQQPLAPTPPPVNMPNFGQNPPLAPDPDAAAFGISPPTPNLRQLGRQAGLPR